MKKKAIIISIKSYKLSIHEKKIISKEKPWGLILFKRNIKTFNQLKKLIKNIRHISKDKKFPILIDEEGGTVSRLSQLINNNIPQKFFGDLFNSHEKISITIYKKYIDQLCKIFRQLGININTVPVLDVLRTNTTKVIGSRSFSKNSRIVKILGQVCVNQYHLNKVATVAKHIPGHGCASVDSHLKTPNVKLNYLKLKKKDFFPFKNINSKFAMTAHVIYKKLDKKNVASFSKKVISEFIRNKIGFKGILISDDISMKALKFNLATNAHKSLQAGCNLVLYCGGNYKDTNKLIKEVPYIDKFTMKKTSEFYKFLR